MKEFFARLNPMERRFVVGVIVVFFLVINLVWVWPRFSDWGLTQTRVKAARDKMALFQTEPESIAFPPCEEKFQYIKNRAMWCRSRTRRYSFPG